MADLGLDPEVQEQIESRITERVFVLALDRVPARKSHARAIPRLSVAMLAGAAAVAVAVTMSMLSDATSPPPPPSGPAALARASAAISGSAGIAHLTIVPVGGNTRYWARRVESWSATSPPRWHTRVYPRPDPHAGVLRDGKLYPVRLPQEYSYGDGKITQYSFDFNEVTVLTGVPADSPSAKNHAITGLRGNDPISVLRRKLDAGDFHDAGLVDADGRQVRRLIAASARGTRRYRTVYDVDPRSFGPVAISDTFSSVDRAGKRRTSTVRLRLSYRRIADTAENASLLRISIPPDAKVKQRAAILPHYRKHR